MPPKSRTKAQDKDPEHVVLVHPEPNHAAPYAVATTPRELNDLVVGSGYRIDGDESLIAATERLTEAMTKAGAEDDAAGTETAATTTQTGPGVGPAGDGGAA